MLEDKIKGVDVSEKDTKEKSEFLKQVIDFANYQKEEVMNGKKGFLILAADGDVSSEGSYTTAIVVGNQEEILNLLKNQLNDKSDISFILRRAMTEVAMEHVMGDLLNRLSKDDG